MLRARCRIFAQKPDWALSHAGLLTLRSSSNIAFGGRPNASTQARKSVRSFTSRASHILLMLTGVSTLPISISRN